MTWPVTSPVTSPIASPATSVIRSPPSPTASAPSTISRSRRSTPSPVPSPRSSSPFSHWACSGPPPVFRATAPGARCPPPSSGWPTRRPPGPQCASSDSPLPSSSCCTSSSVPMTPPAIPPRAPSTSCSGSGSSRPPPPRPRLEPAQPTAHPAPAAAPAAASLAPPRPARPPWSAAALTPPSVPSRPLARRPRPLRIHLARTRLPGPRFAHHPPHRLRRLRHRPTRPRGPLRRIVVRRRRPLRGLLHPPGPLLPLGRRDDGRLVLRNPFHGLDGTPERPGLVATVCVLLGSTAYDGFSDSPWWINTIQTSPLGRTPAATLGLLGSVTLVATLYGLCAAATAWSPARCRAPDRIRPFPPSDRSRLPRGPLFLVVRHGSVTHSNHCGGW